MNEIKTLIESYQDSFLKLYSPDTLKISFESEGEVVKKKYMLDINDTYSYTLHFDATSPGELILTMGASEIKGANLKSSVTKQLDAYMDFMGKKYKENP